MPSVGWIDAVASFACCNRALGNNRITHWIVIAHPDGTGQPLLGREHGAARVAFASVPVPGGQPARDLAANSAHELGAGNRRSAAPLPCVSVLIPHFEHLVAGSQVS